MRVGIDFYNVITQFPDEMRTLAYALSETGQVFIISAYGNRQLKKYNSDPQKYQAIIEGYKIPCSRIELVYFGDDDTKIPELKYEVIKRLGITLMIDDRPSTIEYLHERGICALLMPKPLKDD